MSGPRRLGWDAPAPADLFDHLDRPATQEDTMTTSHADCRKGETCRVWAARVHDEDPATTRLTTTRVRAEEVQPGDVIVFGTLVGTTVRQRVTRVTAEVVRLQDPATRETNDWPVIRLHVGHGGESYDYAPDFPVDVIR